VFDCSVDLSAFVFCRQKLPENSATSQSCSKLPKNLLTENF
jgi:hypothetical protein